MYRLVTSLLLGLSAWSLLAQEEPVIKAALYLSGAASEEEIPSDLPDRLESEPLVRINSPRLRAGLLLSDYQVACIRDYRARHGDILSMEELALVDGFGADAASALSPFLSFSSYRLPGQADTVRTRATALARATLSTAGGKIKASGESLKTGLDWRVGGVWRRTFHGGSTGSFYADATLGAWRLVAGDFNTRWGQGLAAWSGFSMESLSTVGAFMKRPTGLSPVWSYAPSATRRGLALEYAGTRLKASAFLGILHTYGAHTDLFWHAAQLGLTFLWASGSPTFSLDNRLTFHGITFATEIAYRQRSFALKAASMGRMGESWKWAAQARAIPSRFQSRKNGEYGFALGASFAPRGSHTASLTADTAFLPIPGSHPRRFQLRLYTQWQWQLSPSWLLDTRMNMRYRNYEASRTSLRSDLKFSSGPWLSTARIEAVRCGSWGILTYIEGGRKSESSAFYMRITGFSVSDWAARIYCYERDAPGTFSVPAYNGHGLSLSTVGSLKFRPMRFVTFKAHLRAACQLRVHKHPAYTLSLQLQADV